MLLAFDLGDERGFILLKVSSRFYWNASALSNRSSQLENNTNRALGLSTE